MFTNIYEFRNSHRGAISIFFLLHKIINNNKKKPQISNHDQKSKLMKPYAFRDCMYLFYPHMKIQKISSNISFFVFWIVLFCINNTASSNQVGDSHKKVFRYRNNHDLFWKYIYFDSRYFICIFVWIILYFCVEVYFLVNSQKKSILNRILFCFLNFFLCSLCVSFGFDVITHVIISHNNFE